MTVHEVDFGELGCGDGLAREFRRRVLAVEHGDALRSIVRDPAAKEDLPALARLMGHRVLSVESLEDRRLVITVEVKNRE